MNETKQPVKKWRGSAPVKCEVCGRQFDPAVDKFFFDFRMVTGLWTIGCEKCWSKLGTGLGTGHGQRYNLQTLEKEEDTGNAKSDF